MLIKAVKDIGGNSPIYTAEPKPEWFRSKYIHAVTKLSSSLKLTKNLKEHLKTGLLICPPSNLTKLDLEQFRSVVMQSW